MLSCTFPPPPPPKRLKEGFAFLSFSSHSHDHFSSWRGWFHLSVAVDPLKVKQMLSAEFQKYHCDFTP